MSNKPVLITGAATPLGHEVSKTLLAAGREVVALINPDDTESLTAVELEAQGARYALAVGHGRAAVVGRGGEGVSEFDVAHQVPPPAVGRTMVVLRRVSA